MGKHTKRFPVQRVEGGVGLGVRRRVGHGAESRGYEKKYWTMSGAQVSYNAGSSWTAESGLTKGFVARTLP